MPNLKEIRSRIASVASTMQITSAMKMVSAAKLKRAQDKIVQMRPYAEKLTQLLGDLTKNLDPAEGGDFSKQRPVKNNLIVTITSNRGLCGGFNANVIKKAIQIYDKDVNTDILSIGKKSSEFFQKNNYNLISSHDDIYNNLSFDSVASLASEIMDKFIRGDYDRISLIYNQFKNAATQNLLVEDFLPIKLTEDNVDSAASDYIFEPKEQEIVQHLIPKALKTQLFKALLDSLASEHGARMTAMHKATDNASDLKDDLTLSYNKARQAAITGEILEIVGGAEALNN
jgi:F-type H+-transporting ATPase subunit gamma